MSRKRTRRKSNKKGRGRRISTGRMIATAVCAVLACAVIVCAAVYGVSRMEGHEETGQKTDIAAHKIQENKVQENKMQEPGKQEILVKESGSGAPVASENAEKESFVETVQDENETNGEEQIAPGETGPAGTSVSILGDSISTFRDYVPAGYYDFFPENGLVADVNDTWWKQVLDWTGWTLYVNGSSSGATCVGDSTGTADPQCGCNEFRTGALYGPGGAVPDVIIVYMGTNDLLQSIPMGDNDGTRQVAEGQVDTFADAYTLMLTKLQTKYPSSGIYCCTIAQVGDYGTKTPYVDFVNGEGLTAADYSAKITQIAANRNLSVIDLYSCGITVDNLHNTTTDGVHPTPDGMKYIAEAVRKVLD